MNERDTSQLTPLMLAARNGHSDCIMALVKDLGAGELPCTNPHSRTSLCNQTSVPPTSTALLRCTGWPATGVPRLWSFYLTMALTSAPRTATCG